MCDDCDQVYCVCHAFMNSEELRAWEMDRMFEDREFDFPCDYEKDQWLRGAPVEELGRF